MLFAVGLTKIHHVGPVLGRQLIHYCGSPEEVFNASARQLLKIPGVGNNIVNEIRSGKVLVTAEQELRICEEKKIKVLYFKSPLYPSRLSLLPDSPNRGNWTGNIGLSYRWLVRESPLLMALKRWEKF